MGETSFVRDIIVGGGGVGDRDGSGGSDGVHENSATLLF